jgi:hypothetical protein
MADEDVQPTDSEQPKSKRKRAARTNEGTTGLGRGPLAYGRRL